MHIQSIADLRMFRSGSSPMYNNVKENASRSNDVKQQHQARSISTSKCENRPQQAEIIRLFYLSFVTFGSLSVVCLSVQMLATSRNMSLLDPVSVRKVLDSPVTKCYANLSFEAPTSTTISFLLLTQTCDALNRIMLN